MIDSKLKKRALHRAKIIHGQLGGLINAIETEVYCPELLAQSLSIQKSLKSLDAFVLENHLRTHVQTQMKNGDSGNVEKHIKELVRIYTLSNK